MAGLKITGLSGLKGLNRRMASLNRRITKATGVALRKAGRDVTATAKRNHRYVSRTGNLTRSIKWDEEEKNKKVVVFIDDVDARYGIWQHGGTSNKDGSVRITADPFLERPFKRRANRLKRILLARLEKTK